MRHLVTTLLLASASLAAAVPARADFSSCLSGLRSRAAGAGISGATFDRAMAGVQPDMKVIELMQNQPEFKTPIWDYLGTLVDEEKVAEGRRMMQRHASALASAEARYGVDRHTIAAVWGVESPTSANPAANSRWCRRSLPARALRRAATPSFPSS